MEFQGRDGFDKSDTEATESHYIAEAMKDHFFTLHLK